MPLAPFKPVPSLRAAGNHHPTRVAAPRREGRPGPLETRHRFSRLLLLSRTRGGRRRSPAPPARAVWPGRGSPGLHGRANRKTREWREAWGRHAEGSRSAAHELRQEAGAGDQRLERFGGRRGCQSLKLVYTRPPSKCPRLNMYLLSFLTHLPFASFQTS